MRPVLPGDAFDAARALLGCPVPERAACLQRMLAEAAAADAYRKRLGRAHPRWGNGSLMGRARMQALPVRTLDPSSFAPFEGQAAGCRLTFERIAGFRPDRKRMQDLSVDVWLAEIGVAAGRVPVRLELQTPWGAGFAHLVRARDADGTLVFGEDEQ